MRGELGELGLLGRSWRKKSLKRNKCLQWGTHLTPHTHAVNFVPKGLQYCVHVASVAKVTKPSHSGSEWFSPPLACSCMPGEALGLGHLAHAHRMLGEVLGLDLAHAHKVPPGVEHSGQLGEPNSTRAKLLPHLLATPPPWSLSQMRALPGYTPLLSLVSYLWLARHSPLGTAPMRLTF